MTSFEKNSTVSGETFAPGATTPSPVRTKEELLELSKKNDQALAAYKKKAEESKKKAEESKKKAEESAPDGVMTSSNDSSIASSADFTFDPDRVLDDNGDGRGITVKRENFEVTDDRNNYVSLLIPAWPSTLPAPHNPADYPDTYDLIYLWRMEYRQDQFGNTIATPVKVSIEALALPFDVGGGGGGPISVSLDPLFLPQLPEGPVDWLYSLGHSEIGNEIFSAPKRLYVDQFPPSRGVQPRALGRPANLPEGAVIDLDYLRRYSIISFPLSDYSGKWPADQIVINVNGVELAPIDIYPVGGDLVQTIDLSNTIVEGWGAGTKQVRFKLRDRTGWESAESGSLVVNIQLEDVPTVLPAPILQAARVNRDVARAGLTIQIPDIVSAQPNDRLVVILQTPSGPQRLSPITYGTAPRTVVATWSNLAQPNGQANYDLSVTYEWSRGEVTPLQSPPAVVAVDLRTVEPIPVPDDGSPNPLLGQLVVRGGGANPVDNRIRPEDFNLPATIVFTTYPGAEAGSRVRIFYRSGETAEEVIAVPPIELPNPPVEGSTINVELPWATIARHGNGLKDAYFEVYPPAGSEFEDNALLSPVTPVTVAAVVTLTSFVRYLNVDRPDAVNPVTGHGARENRPAGSPVATTNILNCNSQPWNGIQLLINEPTLNIGERVTVQLQYAANATGTAPYQAPVEVSGSVTSSGTITLVVPFSDIIFPAGSPVPRGPLTGSFLSSFTVQRETGVVDMSNAVMVRYAVNGSNEGYCAFWGTGRPRRV
ncbi:hypothetical protein JYG34_20495 [Pseudomonas entomophila]|uniref:hypothetical protein n=1 Tax=Pseudomonas entomophila TaxID=312306 RepID=UPI001BCDC9A7|nr:hypothetical protein [Pseudomonas entomophila]QVM90366.1 hypothetical protein JYG34_20495 [Pseudomonas entomophila]